MLDKRLQTVAALVRPGSRIVDVGTDHGYLPVYLVNEAICPAAIAADLRPGPLEAARRHVFATGLAESIALRLGDGLEPVAPDEVDDIVIAGMGGETIQAVLSAAPWTAAGEHLLLLQPMTKTEYLRKWLVDNGYTFTQERLAFDKEHLYPVFAVRGGKQPPLTAAQEYGGVLLDGDPLYGTYLDERIGKLEKAIEGLRRSVSSGNAVKVKYLTEICRVLKEKRDAI